MKSIENHFKNSIIEFDKPRAERILKGLLKKESGKILINELITNCLNNIGDCWEQGELALSQVYVSGQLCEELVGKFLPAIPVAEDVSLPVAIVNFSDYHSLGKKIVYSYLRSAGIGLLDFGHVTSTGELVEKVRENKVEILLISTLMLPAAMKIREVREELDRIGYKIKILVGGAPFNFDNQLYQQVKADAYGKSPKDAIEIITAWTGRN